MAKKLTPEQQQEFAEITANYPGPISEDAFWRNLSEKRDKDLLLSAELEAFFGKEFYNFFFRR
jgi:hypothetical protein